MIAQKLNVHVLFLSTLVCLTSAHLGAMEEEKQDEILKRSLSGELKRSLSSEKESETTKSPRKSNNNISLFDWASLKGYAQSCFKGWAPTLTLLAGATTYCIKNDRQAPLHVATWAKDTFQEMPWYLKYPGLLVGSCWMYSYYKPRINKSLAYLKAKTS